MYTFFKSGWEGVAGYTLLMGTLLYIAFGSIFASAALYAPWWQLAGVLLVSLKLGTVSVPRQNWPGWIRGTLPVALYASAWSYAISHGAVFTWGDIILRGIADTGALSTLFLIDTILNPQWQNMSQEGRRVLWGCAVFMFSVMMVCWYLFTH